MSSWCPPLPLAFFSSTFPQPPSSSYPCLDHSTYCADSRPGTVFYLFLFSLSPSLPTPNIFITWQRDFVWSINVCTLWNTTCTSGSSIIFAGNECTSLQSRALLGGHCPQQDSSQLNAGVFYCQPSPCTYCFKIADESANCTFMPFEMYFQWCLLTKSALLRCFSDFNVSMNQQTRSRKWEQNACEECPEISHF